MFGLNGVVAFKKVLVFVVVEKDLHNKLAQWQMLFKETQTLMHVKDLTEGEIAENIEVYC